MKKGLIIMTLIFLCTSIPCFAQLIMNHYAEVSDPDDTTCSSVITIHVQVQSRDGSGWVGFSVKNPDSSWTCVRGFHLKPGLNWYKVGVCGAKSGDEYLVQLWRSYDDWKHAWSLTNDGRSGSSYGLPGEISVVSGEVQ